jgi:hypothetical protein
MKISILIISCLVIVLSGLIVRSDIVKNPIQAFSNFHALSSGRVICRWAVDLNNDNQQELLFAAKLTPSELSEEERENGWNPQTKNEIDFDVYIPQGNAYSRSRGIAEDDGMANGAVVSIDRTRCYVGQITQLNKWGLVTVDHEPAGRKNPALNIVYAYTLEGDHLKLTNLAQYDPSKGPNAIYEQYLAKAHRTFVKLDEITLP